jgi:hypothetical protein
VGLCLGGGDLANVDTCLCAGAQLGVEQSVVELSEVAFDMAVVVDGQPLEEALVEQSPLRPVRSAIGVLDVSREFKRSVKLRIEIPR